MPQILKSPEYISVEESKLYGLRRKRDLANLLGISPSELNSFRGDENYEEWPKKTPGKKDRIIEEPLLPLAKALGKLHGLLSLVETPSYLMSGKKKVKPRDNAEIHQHGAHMINVDIEQFYNSTKREFVFETFKKVFKQADDVASVLADITTYKGHIPTGTATSQLMAFWAYKQTFDRIHKLCQSKNITMSVWVDDITFSSDRPLPRNWVKDISKIMTEVELSLKAKKTKIFTSKEYKTVTGTAISPAGEILVKNEKRKEIVDLLRERKVEDFRLKEARQLLGKLTAQRQNEADFFDSVYERCKQRVKKLEKARVKSERKSTVKSVRKSSTTV